MANRIEGCKVGEASGIAFRLKRQSLFTTTELAPSNSNMHVMYINIYMSFENLKIWFKWL